MTANAGIMPLDDVRVIDLTHTAIDRSARAVLGDYGADIIKIERPGTGDPARAMQPFLDDEPGLERSGLFLFLNTNKRSVTLDLESEQGREIVRRLAAGADVVVENFAPGAMEAMGLGYERLSEINPRIILTSLSKYGQTGPYRDYVGTEINLFGMGGNMIASGDVDHEPVKTAGRMVFYHTGTWAPSRPRCRSTRPSSSEAASASTWTSASSRPQHTRSTPGWGVDGVSAHGKRGHSPARAAAVASGVFQCRTAGFS